VRAPDASCRLPLPLKRALHARAMGSSLGCCEGHAVTISLQELRERLQGDRRRMNERPEVWVGIEQLTFKDSPERTFRPAKFSLEGLNMHATLEITGSNQQIMKEIGAEAALKLMDKVRVYATSKKSSELTGQPASPQKVAVSSTSLIELKDKKEPGPDRVGVGKSSWDSKETKVFDLHAVLGISRDTGHNEVLVDIKQLEAEVLGDDGGARRVTLQSSELRKYVQGACSKRVFEVVTQQVNKKLNAAGVTDP